MHDLSKIRAKLTEAVNLLRDGANGPLVRALFDEVEQELGAVWKLDDVSFYKVVHIQFANLIACLDLLGYIDSLDHPGLIAPKARRRQRWYARYGEIDKSDAREIARLRHFE